MTATKDFDVRTALLAFSAVLQCSPVYSATLPVPCVAGSCGAGASAFVTAGGATAVQAGSKLTVNQSTGNATLNWQSFNISKDGSVQFVQPSNTAVALNRIFQANPVSIFGSLQANGRVFLINQNGIIFGPTAQVNVGGLLASTLDLNPFAASNGLVAPGLNGQAALQPFANGLPSAPVAVAQGATLKTGQGGQVLIFAPTITNEGTITTPGGQTMLAAGDQVYLATSTDPNLRGLLVEIGGTGGTVTNGNSSNSSATSPSQLVGQISAGLGNVTLAGLAVNQLGRVSATTSINQNGSIYLQARDHGSIDSNGGLVHGSGGTLNVGARSDDEVTLDTGDPSKTVDSVAQPKSTIALAGQTIDILGDSVLRATGGVIQADARSNQGASAYTNQADGSRVYVADGAILDVSGADVTLPVSSNVIAVQLRGTEFADDPLQRNGPLRGQTVYVDVRAHGTLNGSVWQGTPLANVTGEIAAVSHDVAERNLAGGSITLNSQGDVILAPGSQLDVAGGSITYTAGYVNTSTLLTAAGQAVSISNADPNVLYSGILDSSSFINAKWGAAQTTPATVSTYQTGYVEGKDAGAVSLTAPRFVFDANVNGSVQSGLFQRLPTGSVQLPAGLSPQYRPYNEVPQAATLTVGAPGAAGADFVVGDLVLQPGLELPGLKNADGSAFDPLGTQPLPTGYSASSLRPGLFGAGGFGSAALYSNGEILEPAHAALQFASGGGLTLTAGAIDIQGSIDAPGGSITALAQATVNTAPADVSFEVGALASLTARGGWVNDAQALLLGASNTAPLYLSGGTVSLSAVDASLSLARGSVIDVSGGAQLTAQGAVAAGGGGTIKLSAATSSGNLSPNPDVQLDLGGTLLGYGISKGGSLSLTARGICIAAANCNAGDDTTLWLTPAQLSSGGFGSYKLTAQQAGLSVEPGTAITLQQKNWQLPADMYSRSNASSLAGIGAPVLLPDMIRQPANLSLAVSIPAQSQQNGSNILTVTPDTPALDIGQGVSILGDPGASLSLSSNSRIIVDGALHAPGGSISLALNADLLENTYERSQAIWLGPNGVLDASGMAQFVVGDTGLRTGNVLAGGTVSLRAARGSVELLPGSVIDVSGAAATLDLTPAGGIPQGAQLVASAGGSISLTAAESIVAGGSLRAAAGQAAPGNTQPEGGSLLVSLQPNQRGDAVASSLSGTSTFPGGPREILISSTLPPTVVGEGTPVPDVLAGEALISARTLNDSGFASIALQAGFLATVENQGASVVPVLLPGSIVFQNNVTLSAPRQITLDAATYSVGAGSTAHVQAPYVLFGNSDPLFNPVPAATSGAGTLDVSGGFIELYGVSSLQGIGAAAFASSGDLRLRGLQNLGNSSTELVGALSAAGDLDLSATQIYPTTLSQFLLSSDPIAGTITVHGAPGKPQDVLSAGGVLTLAANTIVQDGTLRAPLGEISLQGNSVQLGAGSLTSTSAEGLTVPFGTTQGGFDWVYPLQSALSIIYGTDGVAPPAQQVRLQGAQVDVHKGAVIDVAGGGDLLAYEWINGVGGTQDVLSQTTRPNQYAIVPGLNIGAAPYDPAISQGSTLAIGDSVYLSGAPGLAAGNYVLLPARYALLPGAFLVTEVSGYQDIQPGQSFVVPSGGNIVAGRLTVAGTSFGDSLTSGFQVVPAPVVLQQAQYTTTSANQFFAQQAATAKQPVPRLPMDSGLLSLVASNELSLNGTLLTKPGVGGIGGAVDIASSEIVVAASAATSAEPGQIVLTAASLDALGAQSLLLGGERSGGSINTAAQSVVIDSGVNLTGPEILLAAQDQITVGSGASLTAQGNAATTPGYALQGDGAFLRVSAGPQADVTRTASSGATGVLSLEKGSTLTANQGSIYLDASANVLAAGGLAATGGDLAVQSTHISVGAVPAGTPGTVLGASALSIAGLRDLQLVSNSSIDFYGGLNLSAQQLTLDSSGLLGFGSSGEAVKIAVAKTLTLQNSQNAPLTAAGSGTGTLALSAADVTLGQGSFGMSGFRAVSLSAQNAISEQSTGVQSNGVASGSNQAQGVFSTTGDLDLSASRITTSAGSSLQLSAAGAVNLSAPAKPATLAAVTQLGGTIAISGSSIALDTSIDLPSGRVSLITNGAGAGHDLALGSKADINVAGLIRSYDGVTVATPGGSASLAAAGNLSLAAGSVIDVGAAAGGNGGTLSVSDPNGTVGIAGTLRGAGAGTQGSVFSIDAKGFGDFTALNQVLNAGGFAGERSARLRGPGDIVVAAGAGNALTAHQVDLQADQGSVIVRGTIDASGSNGGSVLLAAGADVDVSGVIDARATAANGKGGQVALDTANGRLAVESGSAIKLAGAGTGSGGTLQLRAPRDTVFALASGGDGVSVAGSVTGAAKTTLEAFKVYQNTSGIISDEDVSTDAVNPLYQDAASLWSTPGLVSHVTAALGPGIHPATFVLEPGVEIQSTGNLALASPWNLYAWRFGPNNDTPGVLTVRAAGQITIDSQLSDGFETAAAVKLPSTPSSSWSYRLVAGADLTAANPMSVDAQTPADFTITAGVIGTGGRGSPFAPHMVRTGDGFIDIAASGNFVLGNQASLVYTAGVAGPGISVFGRSPAQALQYPINGGDISIDAGQNIEGAVTDQFVNAWLWRTAGSAAIAPQSGLGGPAVSWTVNFGSFEQGVGALAGGDVSVAARGDIVNFSASIPSTGVQIGSKTFPNSIVQTVGGGDLDVSAGGSILGGSYYAGLGNVNLRAGVDIGAPAAVDGVINASPLIGLGDASVSAVAGRNLQVSGIVNPSLLQPGAPQGLGQFYFSSYGVNSRANLTAIGGDLVLANESQTLVQTLSPSFLGQTLGEDQYQGAPVALDVAPPTLDAYALSGNVNLSRVLVLSPAANGNLQIFADKSVVGPSGNISPVQLMVSDADPALLPNIAAPQANLQNYADIAVGLLQSLPDQHAAIPVHASDSPATPVRIVARTGDIVLPPSQPSANASGLWSAKPVRISAAGDIVNLNLVAENLHPADVTSIVAGGSITYPFERSSDGKLQPDGNAITLDGPGELQVQAGGSVNLGTSSGITTRGNLVNPALGASGAGVSVEAGVPGGGAQYSAFITKYILGSDEFDADLIDFAATTLGSVASAAQAKQQFASLGPDLQREFIEQEYFSLIRASGRHAAAGSKDFSAAFAAIQTLFPGANPNPSQGRSNPYTGDIALYFSQIYTLQGGSISLLAPGGLINVGLAAAPLSFGISKSAAQLGLVAQSVGNINAFSYGDFEVNQSRVFAADGGDILVWSTDGNIDAGRGSKSAISAPPPTITINNNGIPVVTFPAALTGSGIQALATTPDVSAGDVDLFAPHGVVNANDAGIVAGNLTIAATAVLGAGNITVSGTSVGVPVTVTGLGAGVAGASSTAGSATGAAADAAAQSRSGPSATPAADSALGWLDVFVTGLGEEQCRPDDIDCLKRQKRN
jgi:filamentous hemagglutinin family protein